MEKQITSEEKGIFALSQNEFVIQYGVSYPYVLTKINTDETYEKIVKDRSLPDTICFDGKNCWSVITTDISTETSLENRFTEQKVLMLPEASITSGMSADSTTVELDNAPQRIFFLYKPQNIPKKCFMLGKKGNRKKVHGQRLHTVKFIYSKEPDEEASSLKMVKYFPFVDQYATSVLLNNLTDFKVAYDLGYSDSKHNDFNSIPETDWKNRTVKTVKVSFTVEIPGKDEQLHSSKILWIP